MEEQQHSIDDIFRQSLGDYREAPPAAAWEGVVSRLDSDEPRQRRFFLRWPWISLALLLLAGGLWYTLSRNNDQDKKPHTVTYENKRAHTSPTAQTTADTPTTAITEQTTTTDQTTASAEQTTTRTRDQATGTTGPARSYAHTSGGRRRRTATRHNTHSSRQHADGHTAGRHSSAPPARHQQAAAATSGNGADQGNGQSRSAHSAAQAAPASRTTQPARTTAGNNNPRRHTNPAAVSGGANTTTEDHPANPSNTGNEHVARNSRSVAARSGNRRSSNANQSATGAGVSGSDQFAGNETGQQPATANPRSSRQPKPAVHEAANGTPERPATTARNNRQRNASSTNRTTVATTPPAEEQPRRRTETAGDNGKRGNRTNDRTEPKRQTPAENVAGSNRQQKEPAVQEKPVRVPIASGALATNKAFENRAAEEKPLTRPQIDPLKEAPPARLAPEAAPEQRPGPLTDKPVKEKNPTITPETAATFKPGSQEVAAGKDDDRRHRETAGADASGKPVTGADDEAADADTDETDGGAGGGGGAGKPARVPRYWGEGLDINAPISLDLFGGFEYALNPPAPNKGVVALQFSWHLNSKIDIGIRPAYRFGSLGQQLYAGGGIYGRVNPVHVDSTAYTPGPTTRYVYIVTQDYDSIRIPSKYTGGKYWDVELPLLLTYQPGRWRFFAGPSFNFGGKINISATDPGYTITRHRRDSVNTEQPRTISSFSNHFNVNLNSTANYTTPTTDPSGVRIGYALGIGYQYRGLLLDLSVHQQLTGFSGVSPDWQKVYSSPAFRLNVGYRLYGPRPVERSMEKERNFMQRL